VEVEPKWPLLDEWHADQASGRSTRVARKTRAIAPPIHDPKNQRRWSRHNSAPTPLTTIPNCWRPKFKLIAVAQFHKSSIISPLRRESYRTQRLIGPSTPAPADPGLIRAGIADRNGEWCGTIALDVSWIKCGHAPARIPRHVRA